MSFDDGLVDAKESGAAGLAVIHHLLEALDPTGAESVANFCE